jgi:hypothetical protein
MKIVSIKDLEAKFTLFEIVPLERLGFDNPAKSIQGLVSALEHCGLVLINSFDSQDILCFEIKDKMQFELLARKILTEDEDELLWLLTDFFEYLLLFLTPQDLLFALTTTKLPDSESPRSRLPAHISQEVGGYTYPPTLARMVCAGALKQFGLAKQAKSVNVRFSFTQETSLAGDITFGNPSLFDFKEFEALSERGYPQLRPVSILSSRLLSQDIIRLLRDEALIEQIEIAQAVSSRFGQFDSRSSFTLFNHFTVQAKPGTQDEILRELVGISLHLNWSHSYGNKLSRKLLMSYGMKQLRRLKVVDERENLLHHSLNILQKFYPTRKDLFEWEVNNIYSNVARYSPDYLHWRSHLNAFVLGTHIDSQFALLIHQVDWDFLEKLGVASADESEKIIGLLQIDPGSLLTKIRVIIEQCISFLYQQKYPRASAATLHNMIQRLDRDSIFPPMISIYLTTLRTSGNLGAHTGTGSKEDVEVLLPLLVRILEWFLDEGVGKV